MNLEQRELSNLAYTAKLLSETSQSAEKIRLKILAEMREKDLVRVVQYDCFTNVEAGDFIVEPDGDGDCIMSGEQWDLRQLHASIPIRIHVVHGTPKADAIRCLKKVLAWIEKDGAWDQAQFDAISFEIRRREPEDARCL